MLSVGQTLTVHPVPTRGPIICSLFSPAACMIFCCCSRSSNSGNCTVSTELEAVSGMVSRSKGHPMLRAHQTRSPNLPRVRNSDAPVILGQQFSRFILLLFSFANPGRQIYAYCLAAKRFPDLRAELLKHAAAGVRFMCAHFWQDAHGNKGLDDIRLAW